MSFTCECKLTSYDDTNRKTASQLNLMISFVKVRLWNWTLQWCWRASWDPGIYHQRLRPAFESRTQAVSCQGADSPAQGKNTNNIFFFVNFFSLRFDVCRCITLSWPTAWSSSLRRTPPWPSRSSRVSSSSGRRPAPRRRSCSSGRLRRYSMSSSLLSLSRSRNLFLNRLPNVFPALTSRYGPLTQILLLTDIIFSHPCSGCRESSLFLEQWIHHVTHWRKQPSHHAHHVPSALQVWLMINIVGSM